MLGRHCFMHILNEIHLPLNILAIIIVCCISQTQTYFSYEDFYYEININRHDNSHILFLYSNNEYSAAV